MGWVVKLLCVLVSISVSVALVIWVRRMQKRKALERRLESWAGNCATNDPQDTIFVLLTTASLQPSLELLPTIDSLFMHAFCPQRIFVGIVASRGSHDKQALLFPKGEADRECFPHASRFAHQVRMTGAVSNEGAAPARAAGLRLLLMHERWLLVVHAHTRFLPGWEHRLVREHGGVARRVLTVRGDVVDTAEFPAVHDVDSATGLPFFRSRAFAEPPASPHRVTAASTRGLFGLAAELRPEGVVGFRDLLFAPPHVDDLRVTLSLRVRGFTLLCPTRATLHHYADPNATAAARGAGDESVRRHHSWLPRVAVLSLQALCACLYTEAAFARVLDDRTLTPTRKLHALLSLPSLPWVSVGMGRACAGPQTLRALAYVDVHATEGGPHQEILEYFRNLGAQSVLARRVLAQDKARTRGLVELLGRMRGQARHPLPRPGSEEWGAQVGLVINLNSESIQQTLDAAVVPLGIVQRELGLDLRDGSVAWEGFMGVSPGGPGAEYEMRELFGSRQAFELEQSRWMRGRS
jgi:hypothetical protein